MHEFYIALPWTAVSTLGQHTGLADARQGGKLVFVSTRPADTSAVAWEIMEAGIRSMTPAQRVA